MRYDKSDVQGTVLASIIVIIIALVLALLGAWIGVALWGAIAVKIFGLPELTFWQFYGLMILLHILFPGGRYTTKKDD